MAKDKSPLVPDLGPIQLSNLFQRRAESKELLSESYVKFDDYDNLSQLSLEYDMENASEGVRVTPGHDRIESFEYSNREKRCEQVKRLLVIVLWFSFAGSREACLWII